MKYLLWIVLIVVALLALRMINLAGAKRRTEAKARKRSGEVPAEPMVRCARCGVYLPRAEAVPGPSGLVCNEPACLERR